MKNVPVIEPCFSNVTWLGYVNLLSRGIHDVFLKNSFFKIAILYNTIIIESEKNEKLLLLKYQKNNKKTFMKKYNFGKAAVTSIKINFTEQVLLTFSFLKCNNFSRGRLIVSVWKMALETRLYRYMTWNNLAHHETIEISFRLGCSNGRLVYFLVLGSMFYISSTIQNNLFKSQMYFCDIVFWFWIYRVFVKCRLWCYLL